MSERLACKGLFGSRTCRNKQTPIQPKLALAERALLVGCQPKLALAERALLVGCPRALRLLKYTAAMCYHVSACGVNRAMTFPNEGRMTGWQSCQVCPNSNGLLTQRTNYSR